MTDMQSGIWRRIKYTLVIWNILLGALAAPASAQTFAGTITNATTRKPSADDDVVLLDFSSGMHEVARTQSDSKGNFTLQVGDSKQPRILRIIHQGTPYYKLLPPNMNSVDLDVYDVSKKVKGIVVTADVTRFQVKEAFLQAVRLFAVKNDSAPPETQMSERNFQFYLPEGARIDHCMARSAGGQPVRTFPLPQKEKNLYSFVFPLRPGETQFQVLFHMPYKGAVTINPRPVYGVEHFVVMLPKQMHFAAVPAATFQAMTDPRQRDTIVQVASNTTAGQPLTFTLSGTGALAESKDKHEGSAQSTNTLGSSRTVQESRAGGQALPPSATSDRSGTFRWYLLGGLGVLLATGAISMARRLTKRRVSHSVPPDVKEKVVVNRAASALAGGSKLILNDLKEQLFRLEVDHKQNRISQEDYEKAMTALRQHLDWAMTGKAPSVS